MIVKLFYLNRKQRQQFDEIEVFLKEYIYKNLMIEDLYILNYDDMDELRCSQYINLLKSSVIKYEDFNIIIKNNNSNEDVYTYFGGLSAYVYSTARMDISRERLETMFPAVAIMDRMVMLPTGIVNAFEVDKSRFSWLPKPLETGGAVLVDYKDRESVKEGIHQIEEQLQYEISRLCVRQMIAGSIPNPDYEELGRLLKTYPDFIQSHLTKIEKKARLRVEAENEIIYLNQRAIVSLNIINQSEFPVGRVRVTVKAPSETLTGTVSEIVEIKDSCSIKFNLRPVASPYCPLEVSIETYELGEASNPLQFPVILNVRPL